MNRLATRISRAEQVILRIETRLDKLQRQMMKLQVRAALLQAKLDERSREAYMSGGVPILYVLTATSAADAASRMSFLSELNRRDAVLARKVTGDDRSHRADRGRGRAGPPDRRAQEAKPGDRPQGTPTQDGAVSTPRRQAQRGRIEQIQIEISLMRLLALCPLGGPFTRSPTTSATCVTSPEVGPTDPPRRRHHGGNARRRSWRHSTAIASVSHSDAGLARRLRPRRISLRIQRAPVHCSLQPATGQTARRRRRIMCGI